MAGVSTQNPTVAGLVSSAEPAQRFGIELGGTTQSRVARALYRLGCDVVDQSAPGYVFVSLTPRQQEHVRTWHGVQRVFPLSDPVEMPAVSGPPQDALTENMLVEITSGSCATLRGLVRARHGDKVEVELFCFGRAMVVTLSVAAVVPVALPEAWQ